MYGGLEPLAAADEVAFLDVAVGALVFEKAEAALAAGAGLGEAGEGAVAVWGPDVPVWAAGTPLDGVVAFAGLIVGFGAALALWANAEPAAWLASSLAACTIIP